MMSSMRKRVSWFLLFTGEIRACMPRYPAPPGPLTQPHSSSTPSPVLFSSFLAGFYFILFIIIIFFHSVTFSFFPVLLISFPAVHLFPFVSFPVLFSSFLDVFLPYLFFILFPDHSSYLFFILFPDHSVPIVSFPVHLLLSTSSSHIQPSLSLFSPILPSF